MVTGKQAIGYMDSPTVSFFKFVFTFRLPETALEFLPALPDPTGEPALEFVFTVWLARQHLFFGR